MILLKQMLILFFIMLIGYLAARRGILDKKVSKSISWLILNVSNPALIIASGISGQNIRTEKILMVLGIAVIMFAVLIAIAEGMIPLLRFPKEDAGIYKILFVFSNIGFMGFPVVQAMYGEEAVLYASLFCIPFNILIYTYGMYSISGEKISWYNAAGKIFNAGTIASALAVIIVICKIPVFGGIQQTASMLGNLTAPLSMMVIGASFQEIRWKQLFYNCKMYIFIAIKMIVVPVIGMLILKSCIDDPLLQGVCFVMLATPSGSMAVMLAQQYDKKCDIAAQGVAITTLVSIATMSILSMWLL